MLVRGPSSLPRVLGGCALVMALSVVFIILVVGVYDELTQPSSVPDRLDAWPTRAATLSILILWLLFAPFAGIVIARLWRITPAPVVGFSLAVMLIGSIPLLILLSQINTCNTDIGFPFETSC